MTGNEGKLPDLTYSPPVTTQNCPFCKGQIFRVFLQGYPPFENSVLMCDRCGGRRGINGMSRWERKPE